MSDRRLYVDYLARMEGDGAMDIVIGENGEIKKAAWEVVSRQGSSRLS